jgi:hypothetical protein
MEKSSNIMESLFERVEDYGLTTFELSKLKALETITSIFVSFLSRMIVSSMILVFFNIGIALLLSEWLGKIYYGFFVIASFYLVAVIVLHFFLRTWIKDYLSNLIIIKSLS